MSPLQHALVPQVVIGYPEQTDLIASNDVLEAIWCVCSGYTVNIEQAREYYLLYDMYDDEKQKILVRIVTLKAKAVDNVGSTSNMW